ncbi:phage major capsid protein [Roseovarius sp. SCSIO 43702]|uniref:phage major capsid protein n=1 Tax=Roseovarius sp. SCSIO 43702 TaxID=2823043 RepID=UPI001C7305ED|nr:phage major capsid protein [Roseovarius sp. SCSIO 43702]QYX58116.1 phage major capsid protein [Roseovarius sp. SCSIO 43702]
MTDMTKPRIRGAVRVRAESGDAKSIVTELNKAFAAFKTEHQEELEGINAKFADVVQAEKVERINAEIGKLQTALDDTNAQLAAARLGGAGDGPAVSTEARDHARAFNQFFRRGTEEGLRELEMKAALRTDSDPDGGYVVPDQMEQTIDRVLGTVSAMRSIASVMSVSAASYKKLVNQGGAGAGWVGERQARPDTATPTLAELSFPAMEIYANPAATQTLLDDARVDIAAWLAEEVSTAFAEAEGAAFISGDGVNQPRGLLSYDTVANASQSWGKIGYTASGVAAALTDSSHNGVDALIDLIYSIKQGYRQNARFLMNKSLQATVRKLKSKTEELYLWQPPVQAGQPATLLGYPITDDDNMPDVAAGAFPVAFGDFRRGYLIVDRFGVRVLRDPYTNKPYVHFYTTKRVGGGVQNFEAIKLLKIAAS